MVYRDVSCFILFPEQEKRLAKNVPQPSEQGGIVKNQVPEHATCRTHGCYRKATTLIYDTKGRKQYCCDEHNKTKVIKEKPRG